jgi:hypothetical protein
MGSNTSEGQSYQRLADTTTDAREARRPQAGPLALLDLPLLRLCVRADCSTSACERKDVPSHMGGM